MKYHVLTLLALLSTLSVAKKVISFTPEERAESAKKILEVDLPALREAKIKSLREKYLETAEEGAEEPNFEDKIAPMPEGPVGRPHYDWGLNHIPAGQFMGYVQLFTEIELLFNEEEKAVKTQERYQNKLDKHGEKIARVDSCYTDNHPEDPETLWIDRFWQKAGAYHLDVENWDKYVAVNKKGDKPWLIVFGTTPYGHPNGQYQTTETMLAKFSCIAQEDEDYNVGWADIRKDELVWEAIDYNNRRHGNMAPYVVLVKDGEVHHSKQINYQVDTAYTKFLHNITEAKFVEPVRYARTTDNLFVEYVLRELANMKFVSKFYNKISQHISDLEEEGQAPSYLLTFREEFMFKNFNNSVSDKHQGINLIKFIYVPALILLYIAWRIFKAIFCALFCSSNDDKIKAE